MIDQWLNRIDQQNEKNLFWFIVGTSILLAAWMQYIQHGWINPDSVIYFEQARLFTLGDWHGAIKIFNWPLYGVCISLISKLTPLGIHASAQLLNMLFFGLATASFLKIIRLASGRNRNIFIGALLLFSSLYIVGDVLEMLMRDTGFWAFYLTALMYFIRYILHRSQSDALLWQLSIIVATLFRIEGILFLILLPLTIVLIKPHGYNQRIQCLFHTYSISIVVTILITVTLITQPQLSMSQFGRLDEVFTSNLYQELTHKLFNQSEIMAQQVLGSYLDEFAIPGLLLTFIYIICAKTISTTGVIGAGLAVFGIKDTTIRIQPIVKHILIAAIGIALFSMGLIIIKVFVLSGRYVVALAWILLIFASFYLTTLSKSKIKRRRVIFASICIILGLSFVKNILPKGQGYNYTQDAITWLHMNKRDNAPVFFSDPRMRFYAKQSYIGKWSDNWTFLKSHIQSQSIDNYDYLIINRNDKKKAQEERVIKLLSGFKEIKRFHSRKKSKYVAIYKKIK